MTTKRLIPILEAHAKRLGCSACLVNRKGRLTVTRTVKPGDEVIKTLNSQNQNTEQK